jgi:hypothetical protein
MAQTDQLPIIPGFTECYGEVVYSGQSLATPCRPVPHTPSAMRKDPDPEPLTGIQIVQSADHLKFPRDVSKIAEESNPAPASRVGNARSVLLFFVA